jgi:hypothetical protein
MQERLKAIIAGFGCNPPSPDYLRLLSADITEGGPKRSLETRSLNARGTGSSNLQRRVYATASRVPLLHWFVLYRWSFQRYLSSRDDALVSPCRAVAGYELGPAPR